MRIFRPTTHLRAFSALLFGASSLFAALAGTDQAWGLYVVSCACLVAGWLLLVWEEQSPRARNRLEEEYDDYLYHYGAASAASIRLLGAADECFPPQVVRCLPSTSPYGLPDEFLDTRNEVIARLHDEASRHNRMFFDGPNTRLIDYSSSPVDASEQKHLTLTLGPVNWFDYSVCEWHLDRMLDPLDLGRLRKYVNLEEVARSGTIKNSTLSNILCTATTLVTADAHLVFSKRSDRVSPKHLRFTSCVAENIHQEKDRSLEPESGGLPTPYRAALRGIEEEVSPRLAAMVRQTPRHLMLLGIDFDLESFHPDLLFLLIWPGSLAEIEVMWKQNPGPDFIEGNLQATPMNRGAIEQLLLLPDWIPGGKASVIRALEFVSALRVRFRGQSLNAILERVIRGEYPSRHH